MILNLVLCVLIVITVFGVIVPINVSPIGTIIVPDHYPTIQQAINASTPGDTIYVRAGTYFENVMINKRINLIGENRDTTIIDGSGVRDVVYLNKNWVNISGFTLRNSGFTGSPNYLEYDAGIGVSSNYNTIYNNHIISNSFGIVIGISEHNRIFSNNISSNQWGIRISSSKNSFNLVLGNNISSNNNYGIWIDFSDNITISNNYISNNNLGIWLSYHSNDNAIYHNNFIDNANQAYDQNANIGNQWDNDYPSGGNYWSDYIGLDLYKGPSQNISGGDGIGDIPYIIDTNTQDNYPLTNSWAPINSAIIDIDPDTLNLKSKGRWITSYITINSPYDVNDIDISTVILEDSIPTEWGDIQNDTLMVKFDRSEVEDLLSPGTYNLKVTGELTDGTEFEGYSDEIRVIDPGK